MRISFVKLTHSDKLTRKLCVPLEPVSLVYPPEDLLAFGSGRILWSELIGLYGEEQSKFYTAYGNECFDPEYSQSANTFLAECHEAWLERAFLYSAMREGLFCKTVAMRTAYATFIGWFVHRATIEQFVDVVTQLFYDAGVLDEWIVSLDDMLSVFSHCHARHSILFNIIAERDAGTLALLEATLMRCHVDRYCAESPLLWEPEVHYIQNTLWYECVVYGVEPTTFLQYVRLELDGVYMAYVDGKEDAISYFYRLHRFLCQKLRHIQMTNDCARGAVISRQKYSYSGCSSPEMRAA